MFEAQYLFMGDAVYSPWVPRGGDNGTFTVDVVELAGTGAQLDVTVIHKNDSTTGAGAPVSGGTMAISAEGVGRVDCSGLKEMVRYRFELNKAGPSDARALFRVLAPVWFDDVRA